MVEVHELEEFGEEAGVAGWEVDLACFAVVEECSRTAEDVGEVG